MAGLEEIFQMGFFCLTRNAPRTSRLDRIQID